MVFEKGVYIVLLVLLIFVLHIAIFYGVCYYKYDRKELLWKKRRKVIRV